MRRLLIAVLLAGCLRSSPDGDTSIAMVSGMDSITQIQVTNLLKQHGISCFMEGSKGYGVFVPSSKAAQATDLLKLDAKLNGYIIHFNDGTRVQPSNATMKLYTINKPIAGLVKQAGSDLPSQLIAVLRSSIIAAASKRHPIVIMINARRRDYLLRSGKLSQAYEGELELGNHSGKSGMRLNFQVWDNGKQVALRGSTEWTQTSK